MSYSPTDVLIFGLVGFAVISGLFFLGRWMADQDSEGVMFSGKIIEFVVCSILSVLFLAMTAQMIGLTDWTK
jgi:hypothetical protein